LQRKFGSPDGGGIYERVSAEGHKEGLAFDFKSIARQPNTLKAHALIAAAADTPVQAVLKEALMIAYFMQGQDLTNDAVLAQIASSAGLPSDTAHAVLQDTSAHQAVATQDAELRGLGISGVPFFIINRKYGVSGAQPAEALLAAMEQALSEPSA
jgi:predicted DsbA family dithiol-disulfide isomerase